MEIHIFDLETSKAQVLSGHSAPILGVSIDPKEKYVVRIFTEIFTVMPSDVWSSLAHLMISGFIKL